MIIALVTCFVRQGVIDADAIEAMCVGLSDAAAHQLRCCLIEAAAPSAAEWNRGNFRAIDGGKE